jgi:tetratricopeptide (TPR) repeat protein
MRGGTLRNAHPLRTGVRCIMRYLGSIVLLLVLPGFAQEPQHVHGGSSAKPPSTAANRFGSVHFDTSCALAVRTDFNNAVAILHSFEYDEAHQAFADVARKDPTCAMAQWGETMSDIHPLWSEYNASQGARDSAAARKLATENPKTTEREKAYIAAISEIFTDQAIASQHDKPDALGFSLPSHDAEVKYSARMAGLHQQFPADREATIFYALSLATIARKADTAHPDLHHCTALLYPLFAEMPNHPGVAHYIIHCNDNPEMAAEGLDAARKYAQIAPSSSHATHMPAHIFAQLGLWDEMIASNKLSIRAAEEDTSASPCQKVGNTLHSMSFLVVALAQTGRMSEAKHVLENALTFKSSVPGSALCEDEANEVLSEYVMESGDWTWAKAIKLEVNPLPAKRANWWLAIGEAAARTGDTARANEAIQALTAMRDANASLPGHTSQNYYEALRLAVAGWLAQQAGQKTQAVLDMRQSADLLDQLGSNYPIDKPVREMLADLLLINGDPASALVEYKVVLLKTPNRFDSLYGAGSVAFAQGDTATASMYYKQLLSFAKGDERPEIVIVRTRAAPTAQNPSDSHVVATVAP